MTHTEGVLKRFEVAQNEDGGTLILEFTGYDGKKYEVGVDLEEFLKRVLVSEKIGVVTYEDADCEDWVSIRGVVKGLPLTAKYGGNI